MTISETQRHRLTTKAIAVLGEAEADTLMALLPMNASDNVVREPDLRAAVAELRADTAHLRTELKGEIAALRTELKGEIADVREDLIALRSHTDTGFTRLEQLIAQTNASTRNWLLTTMIATIGLLSIAQILNR